jgi:hypothetical protein
MLKILLYAITIKTNLPTHLSNDSYGELERRIQGSRTILGLEVTIFQSRGLRDYNI